jgi:tRNA (mo5U34)-methyltransferase
MIDHVAIRQRLETLGLAAWAAVIIRQLEEFFILNPHGDWADWQRVIDAMPELGRGSVCCCDGALRLTPDTPGDSATLSAIEAALRQLHPWRKGPFQVDAFKIDTEWRSDWKWARLTPHIEPLQDRLVLDVGCGNGYHLWRMALEDARHVVGIDPTAVFVAQFLAISKLLAQARPALAERVMLLPLGIESVPVGLRQFDTVFSMGVLYHRRSPLDHLLELKDALRPGGQLVLETLVVDGEPDCVFVPPGRYAKMRNVWFIPSTGQLESWLARCGFKDVRTVDITRTSVAEQRSTSWMTFESLADFLAPNDHTRTVEGHPAPIRAVVTACA